MAKKKIKRKELLKEPDEFLTFSSRLFYWIHTHQRHLAYAGAVILGLFALYMAGYFYYGHLNKQGQTHYNLAYQTMTSNMKPDNDPKKWEEAERLFKKVVKDYSLSKVSRLALPEAAYAAYRQKRYDEAISLYANFLHKIGDDPQYRILTQIALATCYEAKGELAKAAKQLEPITQDMTSPFRELAMMNLARVYRLEHKQKDAKKILEQFVKQFPDSPFLPMVKAILSAAHS